MSRRKLRKDIFENFHFRGHLPPKSEIKNRSNRHLTNSRLQVMGCTAYCLLHVVVQDSKGRGVSEIRSTFLYDVRLQSYGASNCPTFGFRPIFPTVRRLKNGRAAGADGITAELLKGNEKPISEALHKVIMCGPREEFQLNGKKALSSHSTRAKDRSLSAVATGRFIFCLYREKYLHISFWRAFSLYLTSAASIVWFYCRAVYYGCHISLEIVGRVTPKF